MKIPAQAAIWASGAVLSIVVLLAILAGQHKVNQRRWTTNIAPNPEAGSVVFREKGCAACHGANGAGTELAPGLRQRPSASSLPQLVTAMWNHAPRMFDAMQARKLDYPTLSYEETAQLVSYLYVSAYADNGGDAARGERLFKEKRCSKCHDNTSQGVPNISSFPDTATPLAWTQTLWNHASAMQTKMRQAGVSWPTFQSSDMRDMFAFVRHSRNMPNSEPNVTGDPDHGWLLFQQKGCIRCHAVSSEPERVGPQLGASRSLPPTFSEFGASLLNHFPAMQTAMNADNAEVPAFQGNDMSDLVVFLYSLHYMEPTGSPQIGRSVFAWRGCSACHGEDASGTSAAPGLRGRGQTYTAIRLAADLWRHGARMYSRSRNEGKTWPILRDSDIGDLLSFLNTSPEP